MKKLLILAFVICSINSLMAQKSDAEYQLIRRHYTVNADGSMNINFRKELSIFTNKALTAYAWYGETFIVYNPAFESVIINECYTIRKDGTKVEAPKNAFIEQLPSQCESCARFSGMRELVVVHTGMEYDCKIVLDYTIHRQSNVLSERISLCEDAPVKRSEVIVDLNEGSVATSLGQFSKNYKPIMDGHDYHLVANNLPEKLSEPYQPAEKEIYPVLFLSNNNFEMLKGKQLDTPQSVDSFVKKNTWKDALTDLKFFYNHVVNNITLNPLTPQQLNFQVATPEEVWNSNCGTLLEKAYLLKAMLESAGIHATVELPIVQKRADNQIADGKNVIRWVNYYDADNVKVLAEVGDEVYTCNLNGGSSFQTSVSEKKEEPLWTSTQIGEDFEQFDLPLLLNVNVALLVPSRKTALELPKCDINENYTIELPKAYQLTNPVDMTFNKGPLKMKICVSAEGGQLDVQRSISYPSFISTEVYKDFREMLILWERSCHLIFKH